MTPTLRRNARLAWILAVVIEVFAAGVISTADAQAIDAAGQSENVLAADVLAADQGSIADKYSRLEKLMFRMAEYDTTQNPRRAALLHKAIELSKEKSIRLQMETLVRLFNQEELNRAFDNQKDVRADLESLLELLSSEDRADLIKDQRKRYMSYIKEIERILRQQRDVQGRTEGGVDAERLAKSQESIADRTAKLDIRIGDDAGVEGKSPDGETQDSQSKNGETKDGEANDAKSHEPSKDLHGKTPENSKGQESTDDSSKDGEPGVTETDDGANRKQDATDKPKAQRNQQEGKDSEESKDGRSGGSEQRPSQGETQQGQDSSQGESQPDESPQSESQQNEQRPQDGQSSEDQPARKRLRAAEDKMREAQRRLEEARRDDAAEAQEQARRELEAAKAELEEILRQLREEEIERTLALLESRFRRMLEMQVKVYESTMRLDKIPLARRDRHVDLEATKLSFQERRIVMEADKALALLQEEGSSVAFPESVEQMRDDMEDVVDRLTQARIGRMTQSLEEDIIESLDEMVEAMKQAQLEQQQQQEEQQQQQQQGDQEKPLVDQIAELKMLKALQLRVNKRTNRYSNLLEDVDDEAGQATDDELVAALQRLADREARLQEITRDLVLGVNQ